MAFIRVLGDHGVTQIDGDYSNFGFVQGGTLTLTPTSLFGFQSPMVAASLTVFGSAPVVAINGSGVFVNEYASERNGDQWTFYFRAASSVAISISYWVFDTAARAIGASAPEGFKFNDTFGVMVVHGGMDPMKEVDFIDLGVPPDGWNGTSQEGQYATARNYSSARTYAVVQASLCRRQEDWYAANQFDYAVQPGNHMQERRILYGASRSNGSYFEFALATGESRIYETGVSTTDTAFTNGQLAWWVVDVSGLGTAPPVNDVTPNALNWSNISFSTTAEYGIGYTNSLNISGLVQPITLKVSVTGITENFADGYVYAIKNGALQGSPNRHWTQAGAGSFLVTVQNGDQLAFCADGTTTSGRKTGTATVTITNESDGGAVLDTFTISGEVDSDNNFNILDLTPNPISIPSLVGYSSNDSELYTDGRFFQITGINGQIWLRFFRTYYELSQSGGITTRRLLIFHSTVGSGGPWTPYFVGAGTPENPVPYTDVACQNGDWFYVQGWLTTSAGRGYASWRNYIDFHDGITVLGRLATFDVSGTVDANDDFYEADYTVTPQSFPNLVFNTADYYGAASHFWQVTGVNRDVLIRVHVTNLTRNMQDGYLYFARASDGYQYGKQRYALEGPGAGYFDAWIPANTQVYWYFDGNTNSGARSASFDVTVENLSAGQIIGSFSCSGVVDNDNNYNISDPTPSPISFSPISAYQPGSNPVIASSPVYTLSGFNVSTKVRAWYGLSYYSAQSNISSDPYEPNMGPANGATTLFAVVNNQHVYPASHGLAGTYYNGGAEIYAFVEFYVNPGDSIYFATHLSIASNGYGSPTTGSIAGTIYLDPVDASGNVDFANRIGQFSHESGFST